MISWVCWIGIILVLFLLFLAQSHIYSQSTIIYSQITIACLYRDFRNLKFQKCHQVVVPSSQSTNFLILVTFLSWETSSREEHKVFTQFCIEKAAALAPQAPACSAKTFQCQGAPYQRVHLRSVFTSSLQCSRNSYSRFSRNRPVQISPYLKLVMQTQLVSPTGELEHISLLATKMHSQRSCWGLLPSKVIIWEYLDNMAFGAGSQGWAQFLASWSFFATRQLSFLNQFANQEGS